MARMSKIPATPSPRPGSRRRLGAVASIASIAFGLSACAGLATPNPRSLAAQSGPDLRFNNATVATQDLPGMSAWYAATLGLAIEERGRFDAVDAAYVMLKGNGLRIEMIARRAPATREVDRTPPPGHLDVLGLKALVFETDDLPAFTALLQARGADIVWADQQISTDRRSTLIRDPDGNLINIFGPRLAGAS